MSLKLTPKKAAQKLLDQADDNITFDQIMYELHVLQKMEQGLKDIEEGRVTSHDQVNEEFKEWLK
jgi:predicted transcriptional regulator